MLARNSAAEVAAETPVAPEVTPDDALLSLEAALERMLQGVEPLPPETAPASLASALGRVLAEPLHALLTLPPWDNSAMDGFAVRSGDVAAASMDTPVALRVTAEVAAGRAPAGGVVPGTCQRILTGAVVPPGADAVVPLEDTDTQRNDARLPDAVLVRAAAPPGNHIRRAGSDVRAGESILDAGTLLGPAALALLAATGHASVPVLRRPRVAVLSTGDELAAPGQRLSEAQIYDSNGPMLVAQAEAAGCEARSLGLAGDDLDAVVGALRPALEWADLVIVSGGVSVGAHDVVKEAFRQLGELHVWRVAVQPGKPLAFGRARRGAPGGRGSTVPHEPEVVLLFGLPGNPVSSFVTFELFVRPVVRALRGEHHPRQRDAVRATLAEPVAKAPRRRAFVRVRLEDMGRGLVARPSGGQGSHVLSSLALADGLAVVPEEVAALGAGDEVDVWRLDETRR